MTPCMSEVRGLEEAKRALEIAAVGGHNVLMIGPPWSGKTMLARRFPTILPEPSTAEQELFARRAARLKLESTGDRPFRTPHYTVSSRGLLGELLLAEGGVLYLHEVNFFNLQAVSRLPSTAQIIASITPEEAKAEVLTKIIRDLDIQVIVELSPGSSDEWHTLPTGETSLAIRARVTEARAYRAQRGALYESYREDALGACNLVARSIADLARREPWMKDVEEAQGLTR